MKILLDILLLSLLTVGVCEILKHIFLFFTNKSFKEEYCYIVLPLYAESDNIEYKIRTVASRVKWSEYRTVKNIICLDCGLSEEAREICEKTACDYSFVVVLKRDEFFSLNP